MCSRKIIAVLGSLGVLCGTAQAGGVLYVDDDAPPAGNGSTWITAYRFLQDALAKAAATGAIDEIHVAQGVYTPDRDEANPDGATTSCCVSHGGLGCDDSGCEVLVCDVLPSCCDEAWDEVCVTLALDLCGTLCIDTRSATFHLVNGVAVRGGFAGLGAPDPDARDIAMYGTVLSGDLAGDDDTGGSSAENSYTVVTGSGTDAAAVLDGFTITAGNADGPDPGNLEWVRGGGMWILTGSPTVTDCTFDSNYAESFGGALYNREGSSPQITACVFVDNVSGDHSGAVHNFQSSPTFSDCAFTANVALGDVAGAMRNSSSSPTIVGCVFAGNQAAVSAGAVYNNDVVEATFADCTFTNNQTFDLQGTAGAIFNHTCGTGLVISDCSFISNSGSAGGAIYNYSSSPWVMGCRFIDNTSFDNGVGGAIVNGQDADPIFVNCLLRGNHASGGGGGIATGIDCFPRLVNCTIVDNTSDATIGGVYTTDGAGGHSETTILNSIVYGNGGIQIFNYAGAITTVEYSDIQGGYAGTGNINADPLFADADGRLAPGSPAIDAGSCPAVPAGITTDLDGNPRFVDDPCREDTGNPPNDAPYVDMGAYEFQDRSCDLDGGGTVGVTDFLDLLAAWGPCPQPCVPSCPADFDGNCVVGVTDFLILLANWG
ncbi:MAG: choice-of-anchor Q domain-containing protein [Planctomycetota bacterium]|jgi:predicted outer membrane repeat protein